MKRKWKSTIFTILESAVITAFVIGAFFVGRATYQPEVICVDPGRISGIDWTQTEFSFLEITFIHNGTELDFKNKGYFLEGSYDIKNYRYSFTFVNCQLNSSIEFLDFSIEVLDWDRTFITIEHHLGLITWIVFFDYVSVGHTPETYITEFHIDGILFWEVK